MQKKVSGTLHDVLSIEAEQWFWHVGSEPLVASGDVFSDWWVIEHAKQVEEASVGHSGAQMSLVFEHLDLCPVARGPECGGDLYLLFISVPPTSSGQDRQDPCRRSRWTRVQRSPASQAPGSAALLFR